LKDNLRIIKREPNIIDIPIALGIQHTKLRIYKQLKFVILIFLDVQCLDDHLISLFI